MDKLFLGCLLVIVTAFNGATSKEVKAHVGTDITLPCRVDTELCGELHSVKFYRETSRIFVYSQFGGTTRGEGDVTKRMKVEYIAERSEARLIIDPVEIQDEASYKCEITYLEVRENCDVVQIVKLSTLVKPDTVRILTSDENLLTNGSSLGPFNEGTTVQLVCEARGGRPTPKVKWLNDTEEIRSTYSVNETNDGKGTGVAKLQISLSRGDLNRDFKCIVESKALDEPIVSWITADVNVKPTGIKLSGVQNHVVQGSNVKLVCDVTGAKPLAEVKWLNGSNPIHEKFISTKPEAMPDGTFTTKSFLEFAASRWEDGKAFHCYADNSVSTEQGDSSLHGVLVIEVYYPPIVTVSPKNITVNESEKEVMLGCRYQSNPMKIEDALWSKDGKNITTPNDRYEGGNVERLPLLIKNVSREDHGEYTCICKNSVGSQESEDSIFLNVQFTPSVEIEILPPEPVKAEDKKNVTLVCTISQGNPSSFLKVRWFLGDEILTELPECNYTSHDENGKDEGNGGPFCNLDSHILSLVNVSESFAGNYSCQGQNAAGWGPESEPKELVVYYPPSPAKLTATPSNVYKKGSVTLHCSVSDPGRPEEITYVWKRGNHHISDISSSNWTITPVNLETKSYFTCYAKNEGGISLPSTVFVNVSAPPAFIQNLQPYQGILFNSTNITLICRVECSPECSITWLKNGQDLKLKNNLLYSVKTTKYPPDLKKNDFESIESTLVFNMHQWPGEQLDKTAPNSYYTCQSSSNGIGPGVNSTMEIAVDYPPENLVVSSSVVYVEENKKPADIICEGKGHPTLTYTWKKDDATNYSSTTKVLSLKTATRSDSGKYICEATNKHGKETKVAYINVQYVPSCKLELEEYNGGPALECTASANPQEVTFRYQIKGENETIDSSLIIQKGVKSYLQLDSGVDTFRTYQCFVNNSVGTGSPCERDVVGTVPWWKQLFGDNIIIPIAILAGIIIIFILCIIIILICRRKRGNNKLPNQSSLGDKGGLGGAPSGGGTADPLVDPDKLFYENLPFHGMQNPPNKPYRPEFSDLDYADVDYRSYGPINYKAASIYAAMKRKQESEKLEEKDDDLL